MSNIAAPIPIKPEERLLILRPSLLIDADDLFILLMANAKPASTKANTVIIPTAFHSSPGSKNVRITIAPTSISKVSPRVLMALAFMSNATAFNVLPKPFTTLAVLLITFAIGLADFLRISPVPWNIAPNPSRGDASLSSALTALYVVPIVPIPRAAAIIEPKSRPFIQSSIG